MIERVAEKRASVVICVHNRWPALLRCLETLLNSDFRGFEIIVVDDASTDDTPTQLDDHCENEGDISIRVIRSNHNLGPAGARNLGIDAAAGEFICFTDSDCTVDAQWLSRLLAPMDDPGIGGSCGAVHDAPPTSWPEHALAGSAYYGRKSEIFHEANMAVRGRLAKEHHFDETFRYGAEGDDLARRIKADGWAIAFAGDARVTHHQSMTVRGYLNRAYLLGHGSARYWYKHNVLVGRDLLALAGAMLTLPLAAIDWRLRLVPAAFVVLQVMAIVFNELYFKRKTLSDAIYVLPLLLIGYGFRAVGVIGTYARILLGYEEEIRRSKRQSRSASRRR